MHACYSICGKHAITMKADALGFKYPVVDTALCVECGLCEKVCPFHEHNSKNNAEPTEAYAVRHTNLNEVATSRSGAAFVALYQSVLAKNGTVYGAVIDDDFAAAHKKGTSEFFCKKFKGSKYVQSDLGDTFYSVMNDLNNGKYVLFSGTPCQTAGLSSFLKKRNVKSEKLFLVDIVCHGVASPQLWKDILHYVEKRTRKKIRSVNFRDKIGWGWGEHKERLDMTDNTYTYTSLFYKHLMMRPSCGICHFDITKFEVAYNANKYDCQSATIEKSKLFLLNSLSCKIK